MAHHVARQLRQADFVGRDGQRFLDVDRGYDDGIERPRCAAGGISQILRRQALLSEQVDRGDVKAFVENEPIGR